MCYFQKMFEVGRKKIPNNIHITKMETYCRCFSFREENITWDFKKVYIICCHNFVVFGAYPPFAESFKQIMFAWIKIEISFVGTNTYTPFDENPVVSLSVSSVDHIVDENGDATITVIVSPKLKADTYQITVKMLSATASVTFKKNASNKKEITKFGFDGNILTFDANDTIESEIPFGRAYDYEELTDPDSPRFYLYEFEYSNNATVVITATNDTIDDHGLMTYVVSFEVTPEDGGESRTYTHKLKEKQYFAQSGIYAYLYADGEEVGISNNYSSLDELERIGYLAGGTFTYAHAQDSFDGSNDSSLGDGMFMKISFSSCGYPEEIAWLLPDLW